MHTTHIHRHTHTPRRRGDVRRGGGGVGGRGGRGGGGRGGGGGVVRCRPGRAQAPQVSESPVRVAYPSRLSESPVRVACPSRLSESPVRVMGVGRGERRRPRRAHTSARTYVRAHARTHAHTHPQTHAHAHTSARTHFGEQKRAPGACARGVLEIRNSRSCRNACRCLRKRHSSSAHQARARNIHCRARTGRME